MKELLNHELSDAQRMQNIHWMGQISVLLFKIKSMFIYVYINIIYVYIFIYYICLYINIYYIYYTFKENFVVTLHP